MWTAQKLRRVSRSSATAETLAATNATSNGIYMQAVLADVFGEPPILDLTVDSTSLQSLSI